jgi:hypothetical protein
MEIDRGDPGTLSKPNPKKGPFNLIVTPHKSPVMVMVDQTSP